MLASPKELIYLQRQIWASSVGAVRLGADVAAGGRYAIGSARQRQDGKEQAVKSRRALWLAACLVFTVLAAIVLPAMASAVTVEYPIPTANGQPYGIALAPDGSLWFTEQGVSQIGQITPDGYITELGISTPNSAPTGITLGGDLAFWFTERDANQIGRITTEGAVNEYPIPTANSLPAGIVASDSGTLWFTEPGANQIAQIMIGPTAFGTITERPPPTPNSAPVGIVAGPDLALWFTEPGVNQIGQSPFSGPMAEFAIPTPNSVPTGIAVGSDLALWFTEAAANRIGRITPDGAINEFAIPTPNSVPTAIANGADGALWFTEPGTNRIGRITTDGAINEFAIPTPDSRPTGIAGAFDGAMWFTEAGANQIGRINTVPVPVLDQTMEVERVSGQVFVYPPGTSPAARVRRVRVRSSSPLRGVREVPIGSLVDVTRGRVRIYTATGKPGAAQVGEFSAGMFNVLQSPREGHLTELRLAGGANTRVCRAAGKATAARSRRVLRRLSSKAQGRFRTRGRFSAATVRGTAWTMIDRCDGTLTRVTRGTVVVRDFLRKKNITVRAGRSYLARGRAR
jgi:virginiamycin B lyase